MKVKSLLPVFFLTLPIFFFFVSCSGDASQKQTITYDTVAQKKVLQELEIFLADTTIDVEGRYRADFDLSNGNADSSGYLEILQTSDTDRVGTTTWMTYFKSGRVEMTGRTPASLKDVLSFPDWVDTMGISQNSRFLAYATHDSESDVFIEVLDLSALIQQKNPSPLFTINPYPGVCYFKRWEDDRIIFSADINMVGLNNKKNLTYEDEFKDGSDEKTFSFDPLTKLFTEVK